MGGTGVSVGGIDVSVGAGIGVSVGSGRGVCVGGTGVSVGAGVPVFQLVRVRRL